MTVTSSPAPPLSVARILRFWTPLASTWALMAVEGVFLAAILARLDLPRENLAAHGVAFALAILVESPVIMLMSAATALVKDAAGFRALWTFTVRLNLAITAVMVVLVLPPVWGLVARALGLDATVAGLVHGALIFLLPWPAAIGDRRFHQGILIRGGRTGAVAIGTVLRLLSMVGTALGLGFLTDLPGASVAGAALSTGVVVEMLAARVMAAPVKRPLRDAARALTGPAPDHLTQRAVMRFYFPMAMTSILALASQPVITFFMTQAVRPVDSLAVLPVIHGLTFLFRAVGISYHEVAVALVGDEGENYRPVRNVAVGLTVAIAATMSAIAFTPLGAWWLHDVAGLAPDLAAFARVPLMVYALLPSLSVVQHFQRALLVAARATGPMTGATAAELAALAVVLLVVIHVVGVPGALAAALATTGGRGLGLLWLLRPSRRAVAGFVGR